MCPIAGESENAEALPLQYAMFVSAPVPSRSEMSAIVARWGLAIEGECQVATKGVENTNILFDSRGARWVLRLRRASEVAAARREAEVLRRLHAGHLPVQAPRRSQTGERVHFLRKRWPAMVLSFLPGEDLQDRALTVTGARALGRLVGRMDCALARCADLAAAMARDRVGPSHELTALGETRRRLDRLSAEDGRSPVRPARGVPWERLSAAFAVVERSAADWRRLPRQLVHGDVSAQNVLGDPATGAPGSLIDFGDLTVSARVADLAVAVSHFGFAGGRSQPDLMEALWAGWSRVVRALPQERRALGALVTARFVKLVVDHTWRERRVGHHPGHARLIAEGLAGLDALSARPIRVEHQEETACA